MIFKKIFHNLCGKNNKTVQSSSSESSPVSLKTFEIDGTEKSIKKKTHKKQNEKVELETVTKTKSTGSASSSYSKLSTDITLEGTFEITTEASSTTTPVSTSSTVSLQSLKIFKF